MNNKQTKKNLFSPFVLGVTGGIASGKSIITEMFKKLGARVIDADILAREAIENGSEGERQIFEAFGTTDRKELRKIAFRNKANADKLDSIMHPIIIRLIEKSLKKEKEDIQANVIVLVAPLLFECKLHHYCDQTWQLSSKADIRIKRAAKRDNVSRGEIMAIMSRQMSDRHREELADLVIHNDGTVGELESLVLVLFPPSPMS